MSGHLRVSYWPEYASDTYYTVPIHNAKVELYDTRPDLMGSDYSSNNGYYSITWYGAFKYYTVNYHLENDYVKLYEYRSFPSANKPVKVVVMFLPTANNTINLTATSEASNVYYHATQAHSYYKNTFDYSGMDYRLTAVINMDNSYNGNYDKDDDEIQFGSQNSVDWGKYSDVVYHEYFHAVHDKLGGNPTKALQEGMADYFACTINNDSEYGENTASNSHRQLLNNVIYDVNETDYYVTGQSVSGACWDIRELLGSTITDNLVFRALQMSPQPTYIADFALNVKKADYQYYSSSYQEEIVSSFADHGITVPVLSTPTNFLAIFTHDAYPVLSWDANTENDLAGYRVYKKYTTLSGDVTLNEFTTNTTYTDDEFTTKNKFGNDSAEYWVVAVDDYDYESDETTHLSTNGTSQYQWKVVKENEEELLGITTYELFANYPNPFNPTTQISYQIPEDGFVNLDIFNSLGQKVSSIVNEYQSAGSYTFQFNGSRLTNGVYFYKLRSKSYNSVKKMILMK